MDYLQTFYYFDNLESVSFFQILWTSLLVGIFVFFLVWPTAEYFLKRFHFFKKNLPSHNTVCKCTKCRDIKLLSFGIALFVGVIAPTVLIDYFQSNSFIRKVDVIDSSYYQSLPAKSQNDLKAFLLADDPTTGKFEKFIRFPNLNQAIQDINRDIRLSRFTNDTQSDDEVIQYIKNAK